MSDTVAETVELLYNIDQTRLTVDQQIALAQAYAALAQAEHLEQINQMLLSIYQVMNNWVMRRAAEGSIR